MRYLGEEPSRWSKCRRSTAKKVEMISETLEPWTGDNFLDCIRGSS